MARIQNNKDQGGVTTTANVPVEEEEGIGTKIVRGIGGVLSGGLTEAIKGSIDSANYRNTMTNTRPTSSMAGTEPGQAPWKPGDPSPPPAQIIRTNAGGSTPAPATTGAPGTGVSRVQGSVPAGVGGQVGNTGVSTIDTSVNAGGFGGFFGEKKDYPLFTTDIKSDPNYAANRAALAASAGAVAARPTQTMTGATINGAPQDQFRSQQQALAASLGAAANGTGGPSAAEAMLNRATDRNQKQALSLALGARGGNQIAAMKQAQDTRAEIGQDAGQQAAVLRAQEQQQARGQLASVLDQSRGADIGLATSQAGLDQGASSANLTSSVEQQAQRDKMVQFYVSQGLTLDQANQQSDIQQAQWNQGSLASQVAGAHGVSLQNQAQGTQLAGAGLGAMAALVSDKRTKTNVSNGEAETRAFLKALSKSKNFEYKDKAFGEGRHLGIMAQDLEKGAPDIVVDDTDGVKKLDMRKALSASLASLGSLDKRLGKIERKRG